MRAIRGAAGSGPPLDAVLEAPQRSGGVWRPLRRESRATRLEWNRPLFPDRGRRPVLNPVLPPGGHQGQTALWNHGLVPRSSAARGPKYHDGCEVGRPTWTACPRLRGRAGLMRAPRFRTFSPSSLVMMGMLACVCILGGALAGLCFAAGVRNIMLGGRGVSVLAAALTAILDRRKAVLLDPLSERAAVTRADS